MARKKAARSKKPVERQTISAKDIEFVHGEPVPEVYIDGFTGMLVKDGVVKLNLHADFLDLLDGQPKRRIVMRLLMPIPVLLSIAETLQEIASDISADSDSDSAAGRKESRK